MNSRVADKNNLKMLDDIIKEKNEKLEERLKSLVKTMSSSDKDFAIKEK